MSRSAWVLILGCLPSFLAWAASTSLSGQAGVSIPPLCRLSVPGTPLVGRQLLVVVSCALGEGGSGPWVEAPGAVRVTVHSNVPWRLRVMVPAPEWSEAVAVRVGRGEYRPVTEAGVVVTTGRPGVHELLVDYRVDRGRWEAEPVLRVPLVYWIEG